MTLFISVILATAWLESLLRLSLAPRIWNYLLFLACAPLPMLFRQSIESASLTELNLFLTSVENLNSWCALVVIQEMLALVIGASLLKEFVLGEKLKKWKFVALLPSILLPTGILYAEAQLFNHFVSMEFRTLASLLTIGVVVVGWGGGEIIRLLFRNNSDRVRTALNFEWIFLLLAIFLPVAATGRLMEDAPTHLSHLDFLTIGGLILGVLLATIVFTLIRMYKERKFYERYHRNP